MKGQTFYIWVFIPNFLVTLISDLCFGILSISPCLSVSVSVIEKFTENTRFCLICNYLSKIIPALQSRCTRFRFGPLSPDQMIPRLEYVVQQERWVCERKCVDVSFPTTLMLKGWINGWFCRNHIFYKIKQYIEWGKMLKFGLVISVPEAWNQRMHHIVTITHLWINMKGFTQFILTLIWLWINKMNLFGQHWHYSRWDESHCDLIIRWYEKITQHTAGTTKSSSLTLCLAVFRFHSS